MFRQGDIWDIFPFLKLAATSMGPVLQMGIFGIFERHHKEASFGK
jgi:hypothetical protein